MDYSGVSRGLCYIQICPVSGFSCFLSYRINRAHGMRKASVGHTISFSARTDNLIAKSLFDRFGMLSALLVLET
jgi:hypothetical protein